MHIPDVRTLRTVRSTAYHNEVAAELLRELAACDISAEQARRIRCAARQLLLDADALERVWLELHREQQLGSL